jgi:hypothetical protein
LGERNKLSTQLLPPTSSKKERILDWESFNSTFSNLFSPRKHPSNPFSFGIDRKSEKTEKLPSSAFNRLQNRDKKI